MTDKIDWTKPLVFVNENKPQGKIFLVGPHPLEPNYMVLMRVNGYTYDVNKDSGVSSYNGNYRVKNAPEPWEEAYAKYPSYNQKWFKEVFNLGYEKAQSEMV